MASTVYDFHGDIFIYRGLWLIYISAWKNDDDYRITCSQEVMTRQYWWLYICKG